MIYFRAASERQNDRDTPPGYRGTRRSPDHGDGDDDISVLGVTPAGSHRTLAVDAELVARHTSGGPLPHILAKDAGRACSSPSSIQERCRARVLRTRRARGRTGGSRSRPSSSPGRAAEPPLGGRCRVSEEPARQHHSSFSRRVWCLSCRRITAAWPPHGPGPEPRCGRCRRPR